MRLMILAAITLLPTAALGQTTSTNCTAYGGTIQCTSQTPEMRSGVNWSLLGPPVDTGRPVMQGYQDAVRAREERQAAQQEAAVAAASNDAAKAAAGAQAQAALGTQQADDLHRFQSLEAGKLVAAGDCDGAQRFALAVGNFSLAQQVKNYCAK